MSPAIKHTFMGEAQGKSVSSLTISDIEMLPQASILVGVVFNSDDGTCDKVEWGSYELGKDISQGINPDFSSRDISSQIWSLHNVIDGGEADVVVTFSASINAAVCFAVQVEGITTRDQTEGNTNGKAASSPGTASIPTVTFPSALVQAETFVFHVSGQTGSYTGGTFGSPTGSGFTYSGETLGTTAGGAVNNVFYRYYYAITDSTTAVGYGRNDDSVSRWHASVQANYYWNADHRGDALELLHHFETYTDYAKIIQDRGIQVEQYDSVADTYEVLPSADPKVLVQIQRPTTDTDVLD